MSGGDHGSIELSEEEFDNYNKEHFNVLDKLRELVGVRDEAKTFLSTPFGIELRKTLCAEKLKAMKACSTNKNQSRMLEFKYNYDVICGVENIFGLIISDGEEALRQIQLPTGDEP